MYNSLVIIDMKIELGLIVCLLFSGMLHAQKPVTVECRVGEGIGTTIQLFGVDKGEKKVLASASYNQNGYYGFSFIPKYEGFYVVGNGKNYEYPLYLKAGPGPESRRRRPGRRR